MGLFILRAKWAREPHVICFFRLLTQPTCTVTEKDNIKMIRFGVTVDFICRPLVYYIQKNLIKHPFQLIRQDSWNNYQQLQTGKLDVALISPYHLAQSTSGLRILSELAVFSRGESGTALLFFRENLSDLDRIAFRLPEDPYHVLAQLVLTEVYELTTHWEGVTLPLDVDTALEDYSACCYSGNDALEVYLQSEAKLDLVETWCDRIGGPYVHYLIGVRDGFKDKKVIDVLQKSLELGRRNARRIAEEYAADHRNDWDFYLDIIQHWYAFRPGNEVWESCRELTHFLYYHRHIDFIPEFRFF